MDINRAFRFVFEDRQWISKVLIAVLLSLFAWLLIPAFFLYGYMIAIIRRVMNGVPEPLPEWTDWGKLLKDGFFYSVAVLVYTLPFLVLLLIDIGATIGFGSLGDSDLAAIGATGSGLFLVCLALLFFVAVLFLAPALAIQYAIKDDFGACFRFGEVFAIIREHLADILIVFLVTLAAAFALSLIGGVLSIVPCLGWIAAAILSLAAGPYITMVTGHLYGQIASKVLGNKSGGYLPKEPGAA